MSMAELCNDYHFLQALRLTSLFINIFKICIPILLIILGSYNMFQVIISSDQNAIKNQSLKFMRSVISAVIIFLLPTVIKIAFSLVTDIAKISNLVEFCTSNATSANIAHLKELSKIRIEEENKKVGTDYEVSYDKSKFILAKAKANEKNNITTAGSSNLYSFLMNYEGHTPYCDSSNSTYQAVDIGDGAVTIGYGITNHVINVSLGECISTDTVDKYFMDNIDSLRNQVKEEVARTSISDWNDAKTDATTSLAYNCGISYAKKVVEGYAASKNEGALNAFKSCTHASNGDSSFTEGLKTRRDGEYELFISGNYETGFHERQRKYIN